MFIGIEKEYIMNNTENLYFYLFNQLSQLNEQIIKIQQQAEELYLMSDTENKFLQFPMAK